MPLLSIWIRFWALVVLPAFRLLWILLMLNQWWSIRLLPLPLCVYELVSLPLWSLMWLLMRTFSVAEALVVVPFIKIFIPIMSWASFVMFDRASMLFEKILFRSEREVRLIEIIVHHRTFSALQQFFIVNLVHFATIVIVVSMAQTRVLSTCLVPSFPAIRRPHFLIWRFPDGILLPSMVWSTIHFWILDFGSSVLKFLLRN